MKEYTIGDLSYNRDTGELEQFLIFWEGGEPDTRRATVENVLLFDPEDELPFDGGMYDFLSGDVALQLSEDPEVVVASAGDEHSYILSVDGEVVETTPSQTEQLLEGVYGAIVDEIVAPLTAMHEAIISEQVRRSIVNALKRSFDDHHRINIVENGWLVDGFFLVDWNAKMYAANDDRDEGDFVPSGNTAVKKDKTYEFVRLRTTNSLDELTIKIGDSSYTLGEREMLFLGKVTWLLNREHYHPNEPFWDYVNQWTEVEREEPNLDQFDI